MKPKDLEVPSLGKCAVDSPLKLSSYTDDGERVLIDISLDAFHKWRGKKIDPPSFEAAGPRAKIYFDPAATKSGIVSCGGLCPGINDVIRGLTMELYHRYHARNILGFRYGYEGLSPRCGHEPLELTPDMVQGIHEQGGTMLGSSRGPQDIAEMVDTLVRLNISILFCIGGDGTLRGAQQIFREITHRNLKISVVGIPKTIDNDIMWIEKSFGYETAFSAAVQALRSAHVEAEGAYNGIGLVKLMGRQSGFITAGAALANSDANFVLIPEVPFPLEGPGGLFDSLRARLERRHHAVILVAEGAGQELLRKEAADPGADASGNVRLMDIGSFLRDRISAYFKSMNMEITIKYIDPSYMIRSVPSNPSDSIYCSQLARNAVHAAMSGKTGIVVGRWKKVFTHVPIPLVTAGRSRIDPNEHLWRDVIESTGQPNW